MTDKFPRMLIKISSLPQQLRNLYDLKMGYKTSPCFEMVALVHALLVEN